MREFLWEVSLSVPVLVALFLTSLLFVLGVDVVELSKAPVKEITVLELFQIIIFAIVYVMTLVIASGVATLLWSKITSGFISKQYRAHIIHGFYRTPNSGWSHRVNVRYVEWILRNS